MEGKKIEGDWKKVKGCFEDKWKKGKGKQRDEDLREKKQQSWGSENQFNYKHARADGRNEGMEDEKKPDK